MEETLALRSVPPPGRALSVPADDLIHGVLAQYRIVEMLGQGSMGRVYKGFHVGLGRICALKVLHPELVRQQPRVVEWLEGEARAVAGLIHPNIVTVHNLGQDRGYHFVEMEYVRGGHSLQSKISRDGALDPLSATLLLRQLAQALQAAHGAGLIHRDIKPANVLLTHDEQAKLADFGLVRRLDDAESVGGNIAGTPAFMAPELFGGAPPSPQTDLYGLGVTYFYLLTARLPFVAERLSQIIRLHRAAPVPDPRLLNSDIPDELAGLIMRLLAKNPEIRPASAESLIAELDVIVGHLRDTESLVRESLHGLDCLIQHGARDQFRVIVPVPGDRLHEVYIEVVEGRKKERLLSVYAVCAPALPKHFEFALKLNAELTYGSLSIRKVADKSMFVMARTYSRGLVTSADIRAAVQEIARRGDWLEQQLTSTDLY
jgi:serine/threonine-protein kinase